MIRWVADHRRHHAFSDREGDPHSPWRYGETVRALTKGLLYAHIGWLFDVEQTNRAPLRAGPAQGPRHRAGLARCSRLLVATSLLLPAAARRAAHLVVAGRADRVLLGRPGADRACCTTSPGRSTRSATRSASGRSRPATTAGNSGGWPSCPSASPGTTCTTPTRPAPGTACCAARSTPRARVIWLFEKLGWATDVRWPRAERLAARRA